MEPTCAVWYYRYHVVYYELCDDEVEAVRYANSLADSGEGAVAGIQFADGRYIDRDSWVALDEYQRQQSAAYIAELRNNPPKPRPQRDVPLPWDPTKKAHVEAGDPAWLGAAVSR